MTSFSARFLQWEDFMKIVMNKCFGGFQLSPEAIEHDYAQKALRRFTFTSDHGTRAHTCINV